MASRRLGSLLLIYQGPNTATDAEWELSLTLAGTTTARVLVITHGGGPSASQRARLAQVTRNRSIVLAVVSDRIPVRFIVSALALFMPRTRCFSVADIASAYRHLDLDAAQCEVVERNLVEMRALVMGVGSR